MKIAALYIATGKYFIFWQGFLESAKKYLFKDDNYQLDFFLFTDQDIQLNDNNIRVIKIANEPFPMVPLKKFDYFLRVENELKHYDYIYLFNANTLILRNIGTELLPPNESYFAFIQQPYTLNQKNTEFGYERRKSSKAFIEYGDGKYYVWAAFIGGKATHFLEMAKVINEWTISDLKKDIITPWWDESYLNKYVLFLKQNDYTMLSTDLLLVEGYNGNQIQSSYAGIHILEKSKYFDTSFKKRTTVKDRIIQKIKSIFN